MRRERHGGAPGGWCQRVSSTAFRLTRETPWAFFEDLLGVRRTT